MRFAALTIIFLFVAMFSNGDVPAVWKQCTPIGIKTTDVNPQQICCVPFGGLLQKWVNAGSCDSIKFTLSKIPSSPTSNDKITFSATATTVNGGLTEMWIDVDSGGDTFDLSQSPHQSCSGSSCSTSYQPQQNFGAGKTITYKAWAKDSLGRTMQSVDYKFDVGKPGQDNPPGVSIPSDADWHKSDITSVVSYTDDIGLQSCSYEIVDGGTSRGVQSVSCSGTSTDKSVTIRVPTDCSAQGAGACVLKASATDTKGQTTNTQASFNIDTVGPAISNVVSAASCNGVSNEMEVSSTTTIKADALDNYNGIASCHYDATGPGGFSDTRTMTLEPGGASTYAALFTSGSSTGSYSISVTCADNLGNAATGSALTMNVVATETCGPPPATTTTTVPGATTTTMPGATTTTVPGATTTTTPPDFTVSNNPVSASIAAGDNMLATISIVPSNGFSSSVHLAGTWQGAAPAGAEFFYFPEDVGAPYNDAYLVIATGNDASAGTYTFRTTATGGGLTRTSDLTIVVTAAPASFSISHNPFMLTVNKNPLLPVTGTAEIKIAPQNFAGSIALSGTWIFPASVSGITTNINPTTSVSPHGATAAFTVQPSAATGFYIWKTTGVSGASQNNGYLVLQVTAEPPPFIIGLDSVNVGDIRYSLVDENIVEIKGGSPFFTKGMVSDFFVTGTLQGVGEAPCDPSRACSATASINGGPAIAMSWNVFESAWKGELDTVTGQCDQLMNVDVKMGTDIVSGEKTFPAFVSCDPRVVVSPVQARVAVGTKNNKIFGVTVYDPSVIGGPGTKRYLIEMNPSDLDAKSQFLRHWIKILCPSGTCQQSSESNDALRAMMLAGSISEDVLSSDGLLRAGILPTNAARGKYGVQVYLNDNGAQMAGTYKYIFSARASPAIQGTGTLSVYSEGLDEMSTLQLLGALALAAILGRRKK